MRKKIISLLILLLFIFIIIFLLKQRYISINKFIMSNKDTIGVDISSYQGNVNIKKLKDQNIKFIYIKATEGSSFVDPKFHKNWENAKDEKILSGAYHFFSYDSSGKSQAKNYIKHVKNIKGRLLPVVDVEYYGRHHKNPPKKEKVKKELKAYLLEIEKEYKVKPIIYVNNKLYKKYIKKTFDEYKKWITCVYYPINFTYKDDWYIWQYTDKGKLKGYKGKEKYIDMNVINKKKSLEDLIVK